MAVRGKQIGGVKGGCGSYTESELRDRYVGRTYMPATDPKWKVKKTTYNNCGIWVAYTVLRDSFNVLLKDDKGIYNADRAGANAQIMMDAYLLRKSRGDAVEVPQQVVPINITVGGKAEESELVDIADFGDEKNVSENEKLRWVFENLGLTNVEPSSAPSAGTYTYLQRLRADASAKDDFYKSLWPKLLTKEDAEKGSVLSDDGKETIALIDRLLEVVA